MKVKDMLSRFCVNRSDSSSVKLVMYRPDVDRYIITHLYPWDINQNDFRGYGDYPVGSFVIREEELLLHIQEPKKRSS